MTTTTQQTSTSNVGDQSQVDAQLKQAIVDKKNAQIQAWSQQINQLQQAMQSVSSELRSESEQKISDLTAARDQAVTQVHNLQQATQDNWEALLKQTDQLFQGLADRFHGFVDKNS